uniref:DUF19 domain-containing protein n=1 Tax=Strongyloides papillosus TaxID=174720 RepID=A0A0N5BR30_STREA
MITCKNGCNGNALKALGTKYDHCHDKFSIIAECLTNEKFGCFRLTNTYETNEGPIYIENLFGCMKTRRSKIAPLNSTKTYKHIRGVVTKKSMYCFTDICNV